MNKARNYIADYYQSIKSGNVIVGKWVELWYSRVIKGLEDGEWYLNLKKANKAVKFIETFCHHHEGTLAPQLIKLELWQKALVSVIFGIVDDKGARQFREVVVIMGRKNGKTLLASAIAEYETFLGEDYGKRIYFSAPKLEQAALCYDAFYQMISKEEELRTLAKKRRSDIYIQSTNTSARPLAFNSKKSDGFNVSLCVADEIASWQGDAGLKMYEVIRSSFGARREPMLFAISTAGYVTGGIYDELIKRATSVLLGSSKELRLAPFLYMIDDVTKWNDISELYKSMPNLGVSVSVDYMLEEINIAESSISKKVEFLTKYCNIKQSSAQAWLSAEVVEQCSGEKLDIKDFYKSYAVGGIDLSRTTDLTSCCMVIEKDGGLYVFSHFFLPSAKIEERSQADGLPYDIYIKRGLLTPSGEEFVDYRDCFSWFDKMVKEFRVLPLKIGYDRYSAQYLIADLKASGYHCDDVFQGNNLTPVIREAEGLFKEGKLHIGDNDLLKAHLLDTALKHETDNDKVRIVKIQQTGHIDGTAALLDALCVRQKWYGEIGRQLRNEKR